MKTTSHLRMFVVVAMMTATACSETEVVPKTTSNTTPSRQNTEFHTAVTTWTRHEGDTFVGLVSNVPRFDLSTATIDVVGNGRKIRVDNFLDVTRLERLKNSNDGYYWAIAQNNILLLNYVGPSPTSLPPFPLEVIIVFW